MDINQPSLSQYKSSKSGIDRSRSDTKAVSDSTRIKEGSASNEQSLKQLNLKEGQIVKGQIIDHRYNEVRIQIEPGNQVVTAKLSGDIPLSIGQEAQFQVTASSPDSLVLKYLPNEASAATDIMIQKALSATNLPMTDKNKAIVLELLNHNMPIDKQTLQTFIKLSHINREASPLTLVIMYKYNIPITPENVKQFESYQNRTNKLINDISAITKNISELLTESKATQTVSSGNMLNLQANNNSEQIKQSADASPPGAASVIPFDQPPASSNLQEAISRVVRINDQLIHILYPEEVNPKEVNFPDSSSVVKSVIPALYEAVESAPLLPTAENAALLSDILDPKERAALLEYIKTFPDTDGMKGRLETGAVPLQKLLTYIQESLPKVDQTTANLLQSPEYSRLVENAFLQKWTLRPDDIAKKAPIPELYQNLQKDIEKLSQLSKIVRDGTIPPQISDSLKNLHENVSFLKDLNEMFNYIQLPVQLNNRQLHSELYVYTRKKSLREKPDTLSVLLHLDLDNLGPLNIHIQMMQNHIEAKFYTENVPAGQLLQNNLPLLEDSLKKKGYKIKTELISAYREPDIIHDLIEQSSSDSTVKFYTFDVRT